MNNAMKGNVLDWALRTFGDVASNANERAARGLEESIELAQAMGLTEQMANKLVARVYSRPPGEIAREIGQCAMTLQATADLYQLDATAEGVKELNRVLTVPQAEWDRRHAAKVAQGLANIGEPD